MLAEQQLSLFADTQKTPSSQIEKHNEKAEWGTFKDSLKAPVHSWFTYPAGFSYKAVESSLKHYHITQGQTIYDPFMGSGTTNVTAKKLGIHSYGVEAHPFVCKIAKAKLCWNIERHYVLQALAQIEHDVRLQKRQDTPLEILKKEFPKLLLTCYEEATLLELLFIRNALNNLHIDHETYNFFFVGLTGLLRDVSSAATGWPYIAPKKKKTTASNKIPLIEFRRHIYKMLEDIRITIAEADPLYAQSHHHLFNADSRDTTHLIEDTSIDHIFTSPPYLNNFDYADRTRLELYFFGEAKTWGEISQQIRTKLITSATTQISRTDPRYTLSQELFTTCPDVSTYLQDAIEQLGRLRLQKGGKKSYDLLVTGYFNDMYRILQDTFRVLKPGRKAVFVLGDSAPYGVHIPTDEFIGKIGKGIGFSDYHITVLRKRGGKWGENPQRHKVKLQESIVTLTKDL
jgi:DNA modification methylase